VYFHAAQLALHADIHADSELVQDIRRRRYITIVQWAEVSGHAGHTFEEAIDAIRQAIWTEPRLMGSIASLAGESTY